MKKNEMTLLPTQYVSYVRFQAISITTTKCWEFINVPEVLNVHVNENKKKSTFFRKIFFSSREKLTFEK